MGKVMIAITLFVLFSFFLSGCAVFSKKRLGSSDNLENSREEEFDSLKTVACEEADKAGTCQTRLIELGIAMPDECCEVLGRCCE